MKKNLVLLLILIFAFLSVSLFAGVNESMEKVFEYKKKYGAYNPFFRTDKKGEVVAECWNAPYKTWSVEEALVFAKEILPKSLKDTKPDRIYKGSLKEVYKFRDGTKIVLKMMAGRCTLVGVYKPTYNGPDC